MTAPLSDVQIALRDAILNDLGPAFGIGGDQWTRTRTTGDTITGPAASGAGVTITGHVRRAERSSLVGAAPAVAVVDAQWIFTGAVGQDVDVDDVLVSVADSSLRFTVTGVPPAAGYLLALLEQQRGA